jgi:hypothetical protein
VGGWGEFWNLATTKKRKIVKYVYFVLDSLSFWEKKLPFFGKQCHHISTAFSKFRGMFSSFFQLFE